MSGSNKPVKGLLARSFFVLLFATTQIYGLGLREEVKARDGEEVNLPCVVNRAECGDFHSIKWYKENRRFFVYSPLAEFAKAEGELVDRAQLMIDDETREAKLKLEDVKTTDEGEYKCEITFLDITKDCPVVQLVKLTTLAEPKYLNITLPDGKEISSSTTIGPYSEGQELRLLCQSGGGKPIPKVTWYNGTEIISGKASSFEEEDGTGIGRNEIKVKLGRGDLGSRFVCQAENEAVLSPLEAVIDVDVNLRPESTDVIGIDDSIEEGTVVTLMCRSGGARPAATITWFNGSTPFAEMASETVALKDDETYETQSRISFVASRYENDELITCEANNPVLEEYQEEPQRAEVKLDIHYAPVVDISPNNITANETDEVMIYCTYEANPNELQGVRWYRDGQLISTNKTKYEGGNLDQPSLLIKNMSKEDIGIYSCVLENELGAGESQNISTVDVLFTPVVMLRMDPPSPVSESDKRNVTLFCDVMEGNPDFLYSVKWYMDGVLLKQLPLCDEAGIESGLCDIDPSKLLLEHVTKSFHGNFSCEGANEAGWSEESDEEELIIYYPPGPSFIRKDLEEVVKGDSITLTCEVDDLGRPEAEDYIWTRAGHVVRDVTTSNWTIDPVMLETEANISCVAVNEVGQGYPDFINIEVFAPPTFIERLPPYTGAVAESANFSIQCQVECSPICDIFWLKDGVPIAEDDPRFDINTTLVEADLAKNDFESVHSMLFWNIEEWPGSKLDRIVDSANYTCQSTGNLVGKQGVGSTTYFRVEYPPENIEISERLITLEEGSSSDKVLCTAEAYPEANYLWQHDGETVATHNVLFFDYGIRRQQAGNYSCVAANRHGELAMITRIDVQYKPECNIKQSEDDGSILLTCESSANPKDVTFGWFRGNESLTNEDVENNGLISVLTLDPSPENFGTYYCYVNNSVGAGEPCEIDLQGIGLIKMGSTVNIIIIVAIIAAIIVALLIIVVCCVILCRRKNQKKADEKYPGNKSSPDSGHPSDEPNGFQPGDSKTFYENLPFHGMQPPNKQKLSPPPDANLDYADADYKDLYEFGPLSYTAASREAAEAKNKAAKKPPPTPTPSTNGQGKSPASPPQE